MLPGFDPGSYLDSLARHRATEINLVPTMLGMLLSSGAAERAVVCVMPGDGLAALCTEAGATALTVRPGVTPASDELAAAIDRAGSREIVLLPNDGTLWHVSAAAAEQARERGIRVAVIPTTPVELAAWWRQLNDPTLAELIGRALQNSLDLRAAQSKLREARARQNAIATRLESAVSRARAREVLHGGRTEDAFSKFEVLERRADFAEGRADALGMTGPKSLEEEIAELRSSEKVDAELEAMKAAFAARNQ